MDDTMSRGLWAAGEPIHAVTYFAPASHAAWAAAGLRGFWRGYFATRTAPLGVVPAEVVTAVVYNFAPAMVARAIPEVWIAVTPPAAWSARLAGVDRGLRDALGDEVVAASAGPAALARAALDGCDPAGRALFAAHLALPWPDEAHLALWQALTLLREYRGDGHNLALLAAGVDGCAAHVLAAATGGAPRALTQPNRGWSDEDWDARVADLAARGLLGPAGEATDAGRALHAEVEDATDRAAAGPWRALGDRRAEDLAADLVPLARKLVDTGPVPVPNPMGAPRP
ncbi:MAG TPA: hypothetical protein VH479_03065 [Acidimicrobiales bacterium]